MAKGRRRWIVVGGVVALVSAFWLLIPREPSYRFMEEYRTRMKRLPPNIVPPSTTPYESRTYALHVDPDQLLAAMKRDLTADGWSVTDETNIGLPREVGPGFMEWIFRRGDDTISFDVEDRRGREADTRISFTSRPGWLRRQWLGLRKMLHR